MTGNTDGTTIFYKMKIKRTREPIEVFEKMASKIKKRGATKNWQCEYDEICFRVDFGDKSSEEFAVSFDENNICEGCCKVSFPLSGEEFEDEKKSSFKALLNMLYSVRTSFSEMKITDDYCISDSYLDSKVNKIAFRELSDEEQARAERVFSSGHTSIDDFITALVFNLRELPYSDDFVPYINRNIHDITMRWRDISAEKKHFYSEFVHSFLYETSGYKEYDRIYESPQYVGDINGLIFAIGAFVTGILHILGMDKMCFGFEPKMSQVLRLYNTKYQPLMETETNDFGKCVLTYRFIVSAYDYLGFRYVGITKTGNDNISSELADAIRGYIKKGDRQRYIKALDSEFGKV